MLDCVMTTPQDHAIHRNSFDEFDLDDLEEAHLYALAIALENSPQAQEPSVEHEGVLTIHTFSQRHTSTESVSTVPALPTPDDAEEIGTCVDPSRVHPVLD